MVSRTRLDETLGHAPLDVFPTGPNTAEYVPNVSCEQNLAYLSAKLTAEPSLVAICGPSGTGRTMLLRRLMTRLADRFQPVYVPSGSLTASEVKAWAEASTLGSLRSLQLPLLLGIDEADAIGSQNVRWLKECVASERARVVLVLEERPEGISPELRSAISTRVFTEPLSLEESRCHIESRLARGGETLQPDTVTRLALASGGNLSTLHRLGGAELLSRRSERTGNARLQDPTPGRETRQGAWWQRLSSLLKRAQNSFQRMSSTAETIVMTMRVPPPIYSSRADQVDLEPEIDAFIYGLGELVDAFQDAEAAGQTSRLEALAIHLAERAPQVGFAALGIGAEGVRAACKSDDPNAARKAVQELTELAQRVRRGHRSAAS